MKVAVILVSMMVFAGVVGAQVTEPPVADKPYTEFFRFKYLALSEPWWRNCRLGPSKANTTPTPRDRFFTYMKAYLTENGTLEFDSRTNTLIVTDRLENLRSLVSFLKSVDRKDVSIEQVTGELKPSQLVESDEKLILDAARPDGNEDDPTN